MRDPLDIVAGTRRFPAPAPANAPKDGISPQWTPRQSDLSRQIQSLCHPAKITGPIIAGKRDLTTIGKDIQHGLIRTDKEGQDWRFVTFRIWRDIENKVLNNETPGAKKLSGLQELKRFDLSILPHLAKNISPAEKCAFIESAILHLAWVAHEGIQSQLHLAIMEHSLCLLKQSLPESIKQAAEEYDFNDRLGRVLSHVIRRAAETTASKLKKSAWEITIEMANLNLSGTGIDLFDAASELILVLQEARSNSLGLKEALCYLHNYDKEGSIDHLRQNDEEAQLIYQDETDEEQSEDFDHSREALSRTFFRKSARKRDFYQEDKGTLYEQLGEKLIETMLRSPRGTHANFWIKFLEQTSMADPLWPSAMRGLEQSDPDQFNYFTKRLIIASSHSRAAAFNLMMVAALAEQSKGSHYNGFIKVGMEIANVLEKSTRLRAWNNIYTKYYELDRGTQDIIRGAKMRLHFILVGANEQARE